MRLYGSPLSDSFYHAGFYSLAVTELHRITLQPQNPTTAYSCLREDKHFYRFRQEIRNLFSYNHTNDGIQGIEEPPLQGVSTAKTGCLGRQSQPLSRLFSKPFAAIV